MLESRNQRTQDVFRALMDRYLETGQPVGSRELTALLGNRWSSATLRNDMAALEDSGLLKSPHTSAGRMPTEVGLRMYVDEMLEVRMPGDAERKSIESLKNDPHASLETLLDQATQMVSGLSRYAAIVAAPKLDRVVSHIQFMQLGSGQVMAVIVFADGAIDNRMLDLKGVTPGALESATNYLNARVTGKTIAQMRQSILDEIKQNKSQLDALAASLVQAGLIISDAKTGHYFVRGYANLLDPQAMGDIDNLQGLIDTLDRQETMAKMLAAADAGQGVRVFIGRENALFPHSGLSLITAQAKGPNSQIIGTIGVIGPTHMNYGRIVPIVDYTSQVMSQIMGRLVG